MATGDKAPDAFRTIGELSADLGIAQHVLRYWETKFPQLRPLQRAGNRRYYRPADVALVRRIQHLLGPEGYTVKGVQKLLASKEAPAAVPAAPAPQPAQQAASQVAAPASVAPGLDVDRLVALRDRLHAALTE